MIVNTITYLYCIEYFHPNKKCAFLYEVKFTIKLSAHHAIMSLMSNEKSNIVFQLNELRT